MTQDEMIDTAKMMNDHLKSLSKKKLYATASYYPKNDKYPSRIVVEGIKNLHSTGKFSYQDRASINEIINIHAVGMNVKVISTDPCMHNAIITVA